MVRRPCGGSITLSVQKNTELPRRVPREALMRGAFKAAMFIVMVNHPFIPVSAGAKKRYTRKGSLVLHPETRMDDHFVIQWGYFLA